MKLTKLIFKNFKIILRSQVSSLIIIFGPLLIMLLAGFAFNNNASFELNVGLFFGEKNDLTQRFADSLGNEFQIYEYTSEQQCIDDVSNLKIHSCLVFPANFELAEGNQNVINIHVDNSKVNIVDLIQNTLNKVISVESSEISSDLTQVLIVSINDVSTKLDTWKTSNIATIKKDQQTLITSLQSGKEDLANLDVSTDSDKGQLQKLRDQHNALVTELNYAHDDYDLAVTLTQQVIDDLDNSNSSSLADDAQTELDTIIETAYEHSNSSEETVDAMVVAVDSMATLVNDLKSKVQATQTLKKDFTKQFDQNVAAINQINDKLTALTNDFDAVNNKLRNIQIKDATSIVSPVTSAVVPVVTNATKLNYIFPSLMMLVLMFVCVMLSATIVVVEKLSPAKFRLFTTPTSDIVFITSNFFTVLIVGAFQVVLMLLLAFYVFHIDILANIANTAVILLISSIIFTLLGMCLGYMFSNEQTTILGAISLGSAFLLVSDLILPLESIPQDLRVVIAQTPFVLATELLRRTLLFGANLKELGVDLFMAIIYCVSLFAFIVIAHKLLKVIFLFNNTKKAKKKA
ncbi:MAG TPA: ABC transporter permease [Acidobacteriota bacterium]|nr:ABC transporter permease [Acidobacteriota bacterium]